MRGVWRGQSGRAARIKLETCAAPSLPPLVFHHSTPNAEARDDLAPISLDNADDGRRTSVDAQWLRHDAANSSASSYSVSS